MNMLSKSVFRLLVLAVFPLVMSACGEIEMHDSSSDVAYSSLIGRKITVKEDLWALGISSNDRPPADYYLLVGGVGFSGPEVVKRRRINEGSIVQICKVLSANSMFYSRVEYVVKEVSGSAFTGQELRIELVPERFGGKRTLESKYFEMIK